MQVKSNLNRAHLRPGPPSEVRSNGPTCHSAAMAPVNASKRRDSEKEGPDETLVSGKLFDNGWQMRNHAIAAR